jgi:hypothetical protein
MDQPEGGPVMGGEEAHLEPRGPWSFLGASLRGGFGPWQLQLTLAWVALFLLPAVLWAFHLRGLAGWSSLPSYWGEMISARDVWEMAINGSLIRHPVGFLTSLAAFGALLWVLWAGWRVQTEAVGLPPRFQAWLFAFLDGGLIGIPPLLLLAYCLLWFLALLAQTGIQGLGWLDLVGGSLLKVSCLSALFLQVWLCRLERAAGRPGLLLGSWGDLARHLGRSFLRLWLHPVQWGILVVGGAALRLGLTFLALHTAWRMGGGTPGRVWAGLALQVLAVALNGWLLGWFLRLVAMFWKQDARVRAEIRILERAVRGDSEAAREV